FRGRRDHQVKIRGFRVELGEIEAVLSHHPGVREAAVLALPNGSGDRQLVAYVVATAGAALGAGELRARMARSLPEYMVPASYVFLEALPVTPNGKLDRKALPAPGGARPELSSRYVEPGTPVESLLAGIWAEVLHKERIGVLDDFFELGGHSLLATQVAARVRQAFAVDIPLRSIFDAPTVAALARRVDAARRAGSGRDTLPVAPVRADTYPLSFMQQRLWFLARLEAGSTEYNLFTGLSITGPLDLARLARSIEEVVLRHAALRTTFRDEDGQPYQVVAPSIDLAVPVIDLAAVPAAGEGELRRLSAAAAGLPFDLSRGPLLRIWVLRRGPQEHVLLFGLHHIVADAWSMEILVREVISVYARSAEELPLPPLPVQYPDFACWQRQWLQGEVLDGLLSYWTRRLGGAVPAELPTDRPRSEMRSYRGARYGEEMPDALSADLRQLARREDCTVFMVLVAVLSVLLHRLTGETRIFVGTDAANRGLPELEGLIGLFVNQLVLDTDVSGNPSFRKLLRRVREGTLEAFDHQELPFDLLVQALRPGRDLGRTPLFQVKLIHRVAAPGDLPLPGFAASALDLRAEPARFDLAIFVTEVAERVRIDWIYATDLFDAGTIERLARLHGALLVGTLASPDARLSALAGTAAEGGRQPASAPAVKKTLGLWAVRPTPVPAKDETPEDISRGAAVAPRAVVEPT
ncbi:MAG TPA: condensation domain-containing protein, partial [Thermoanaerobaculia bacterium]|nr:condensation domain-containing protein [Thermoanaerobaculia bacterium]